MEICERVAKLESSMKTVFNDISDIKSDNKILHEISKNLAVLAENYKYQGEKIEKIECNVSGLKDDIDNIKDIPAQRWNTTVKVIITAIITGVVGYLLGLLLK